MASPGKKVGQASVGGKQPAFTYAADGRHRPTQSSGGPLTNKEENRKKGDEDLLNESIRDVLPIGKGGYEAGHLIADRFGASSKLENLVPMSFRSNRSWMGSFEGFVSRLIGGKHGDIYATVRPVYPAGLADQVPPAGRDAQGQVPPHVMQYVEFLERIPDQIAYTVEGEKDGARTPITSETFVSEDRGNLPKAREAAKAAGHGRAGDMYGGKDPSAVVKAKARAELATFLGKPVHTLHDLQGIAQKILGRLRSEGLKNLTIAPGKSPGKYEILAEASPVEMVAEATVLDAEEKGAGKQGPATGKQVDEYLDASPFLKQYVEAKVKQGIKAEGHVHFHDSTAFAAAFEKYAVGRGMTSDQAKAIEPSVNAYRDGTEIHLHQDRAKATTTIHEAMHLYQDDAGFVPTVGGAAKEGATEFFAREICTEQKISRSGFYEDELNSIRKLANVAGREKLAAAYFKGSVAELEAAIDAKGKGIFAKWCAFMKARQFAKADDLLK